MDEKNTNKLKIKESFLKHGVLYFIVGLGLIVAYYCINHVPVIAAGVSKINNILMPFYLGIIMAYLMCPLYNGIVRLLYGASRNGSAPKPRRALKLAKFIATIAAIAVIRLQASALTKVRQVGWKPVVLLPAFTSGS